MIKLQKLYQCYDQLLDMIYPRHCILCGIVTKHGICSECLPLLPCCQRACCLCGCALADASSDYCGQCLSKRPYFDHVFAAFWFLPPIDQLIIDYKYHQRWENLALLATLFTQYCPPPKDSCQLIAVPSHKHRVRQRGFNAVYELVRAIHKRTALNYSLSTVVRIRNTQMQTGMGKLQRQRNVRAAFALSQPLQTKHVIIFDDVVTTGATVNELAKTIKRAGVERVDVWALARAIK